MPDAPNRAKIIRNTANVDSMRVAVRLGLPLISDLAITLLINKKIIVYYK